MADNINRLARPLVAKVVARIPDTGGGAFGAARLAQIVSALQARLVPSNGERPSRPTDSTWVRHPKVPMSAATERRLVRLAEQASTQDRKISPMQLAAQLLGDAVARLPEG